MVNLSRLEYKQTSGFDVVLGKINFVRSAAIGKQNQQIEVVSMRFFYKRMNFQMVFKGVDVQLFFTKISFEMVNIVNRLFFQNVFIVL